ncbi:hypothetical protein ACIRRA_08675 [Nocardia sp. NPDC101769]|uniref:hypothetical protein n=1 Tax=Nocardia sp. NPDC101769 TaxID=3364333 RepID=UPI0037F41BEA
MSVAGANGPVARPSKPPYAVPLATTLQWLVVLAGPITFHIVYVTRNGLKV